MRPRLACLVAAHLLDVTAPAAVCLLPPDVRWLPVLWAMAVLPLAALLLLAFWLGMGTSPWRYRLLGSVAAVAYVAIWPVIGERLTPSGDEFLGSPEFYPSLCMSSALLVGMLGAALWILRRRIQLSRTAQTATHRTRTQFSLFSVLLLTSFVALVLALVRHARGEDAGAEPWESVGWQIAALYALLIITIVANLGCAVAAALSPGPVATRSMLALIVSALFGTALAMALFVSRLAWWLVPAAASSLVLLLGIVLASLLVVRSCGYRLVRTGHEPEVTPAAGD